MNYSFEYIDIILLAMIAGFIFLRLRGILGKKTGHEENMRAAFQEDFSSKKEKSEKIDENNFDEKAKGDFLKGAKIAYESIITSFSSGELKKIKILLDKKVFNEFSEAIKERKNKGLTSETTFIGINSADIKNYSQINNMFEVTVDFVSEIISSVEDKDKKLVSGDPKKVKKVYDTWKFSRDIKSLSPNWLLIDTQA
jgi:predicted lipid-binding transport protein (Tim44 family)